MRRILLWLLSFLPGDPPAPPAPVSSPRWWGELEIEGADGRTYVNTRHPAFVPNDGLMFRARIVVASPESALTPAETREVCARYLELELAAGCLRSDYDELRRERESATRKG